MKKNIIVLFPTWSEAKPFMHRYGNSIEVWKCGVGTTECAARTSKIIKNRNPDLLILAGIAGAYEGSGLHKGDVVTVTRENSADLGAFRDSEFQPIANSGGNPSDNYYINDTRLPDFLKRVSSNTVNAAGTPYHNPHFNTAEIENMEGASFFAVCEGLGVPYAEIRSISNIVREARSGWIIPEAADTLAAAVFEFIESYLRDLHRQ